MSVPDNGRKRPILLVCLALAAAVVVGVLVAALAVQTRPTAARLPEEVVAVATPLTLTTTVGGSTTTTTSASPTTTTTTPTTTTRSSTSTVKAAPPVVTSSAAKPANSGPENEVLALVNKERRANGCGDLHWDDRLALAARKHSQDMAVRNYFSHDTPEGVDPWQRIKAVGYADPSGENIAAGQNSPESVMTSWMNSPGHRANILNCSFKALGVGEYKGGSYGFYWTQDFGYA
ncbi:uncharacterized protein YkwD [Kutzneria viridogrisea]|uniref:Uncharacterized protein YkwD n=1 Tax=Kutzneria viridogrisea TaxID=47990 RepID=A0ABR6BKE5_9PSEU|nr:uncharacterized protein YkwD [Kutzneria viridogrisea]